MTPKNLKPEKKDINSISSNRTPPVNVKLGKIPPIPLRHPVAEDILPDEATNHEALDHENKSETSLTNEASILGLNHIRTRSSKSPLRACSSSSDGVDSLGNKSSSVAGNSSEQGGFAFSLIRKY